MQDLLMVLTALIITTGGVVFYGFLVGRASRYCNKEANFMFWLTFPIQVAYYFGKKGKEDNSKKEVKKEVEIFSEIAEIRDKILTLEESLQNIPILIKEILKVEKNQKRTKETKETSKKEIQNVPAPQDLKE